MSRVAPLMLAFALLVGACSGGSDDAAPTTTGAPVTTEPPLETEVATTTTEATTTTTVAPTTTIDEAALLAEAEAAYLEAFEVGKEVIRNPDDPTNEERIREHFTGDNLDVALENLRRSAEGGFVAKVNQEAPSGATIVEPAEFVDGDTTLARITVCEFNSDRIYEIGTAPDGDDELRRDDPVTVLITVRMALVDNQWKSESGTRGDEIRAEDDRCADA